MKKLFIFLTLLSLANMLSANNISISNLKLTGKNTVSHYTIVQFDISWENSWRTSSAPNNWDAAWIFVKYRSLGGTWSHAWLNNTGYTAPSGSTIETGLLDPSSSFNATTNPCMGVFLYRNADGTGTFTKTGVQLRWNYGANGVTDATIVEIKVFAIEMVYIPQGAFYAGDGTTSNVYGQFTEHNTTSNYLVTDESLPSTLGGITAGNLGNNNTSGQGIADDFNNSTTKALPLAYPKGYNPLYGMKYEISQQEYVDFLNTVTATQATARYPNYNGSSRYAITVSGGVYQTTLPNVACNYLSWADLAAYLDWSSLRPMTELEFEKSCRGTAAAVPKEQAWGSSTVVSSTYSLLNSGTANEAIGANYSTILGNESYNITNSSVSAPLRVGIFAGTSGIINRVTSGSTFYGQMEMSGNIWERAVNLGTPEGRTFTGMHGNGALTAAGDADPLYWPSVLSATGICYRGGSLVTNAVETTVSGRYYNNTNLNSREYYMGGRGGRAISLPSMTTTAVGTITSNSAASGGNITSDGGKSITGRGICWSTSTGPTIALSTKTSDGSGTGVFTSSLVNLNAGITFYVRAYATTGWGTSYGNEVSFTTTAFVCGTSTITVAHTVSDGVGPIDKTVTYGTVTNVPGESSKCWITQNLGASRQPLSVDDATEASAGWYWQYNRKQGFMHDGTTRTPASWDATNDASSSTWEAVKDPCTLELGTPWHVPTDVEWTDVDQPSGGNWSTQPDPWGSLLKMHDAGYLANADGSLMDRSTPSSYGVYWSNAEVLSNHGWDLNFNSTMCTVYNGHVKSYGFTLRCVRDLLPTVSTTSISSIASTTASSGGSVTSDGGFTVTARGVCWSTSTAPTIALSTKTSNGTGTGTFTSNLTGLSVSTKYYVRAYATNSAGTAYGNEVSFTTTACFIAGTKITMADGSSKNIEDVQTGDKVQSVDPETMKPVISTVEKTMSNPPAQNLVKITFSNGKSNTNTKEHPYWVSGKGWCCVDPDILKSSTVIYSKPLATGDHCLFTGNNHMTEVTITAIEEQPRLSLPTYNFTVERTNCYFANGVLVHNKP